MARQLDVQSAPMKPGCLPRSLWAGFWKLAALMVLYGGTVSLRAHVGSPTVFFEGLAGPY